MTATVDRQRRVILRQAMPGDRFDVRIEGPGKYILTKLEPARPKPDRVRIVKRNGYTVGVLDHPIDPEAIKQALANFP